MKRFKYQFVSLCVLVVSYVLIRFVLFIHGMKQWPFVLLIFGVIIIGICFLRNRRLLPVFTVIGYDIGLVAGLLFNSDYGRGLNNMWIIWSITMVAFIVVGIVSEIAKAKNEP